MRACRLRIAEAHPSKVLKVLVEQHHHNNSSSHNTLAFLLTDGSCVLLSLLLGLPKAVLRIPKPCSDASFLRLQSQRGHSHEGIVAHSKEDLTYLRQGGAPEGSKELQVQQGISKQRGKSVSFSGELERENGSLASKVPNENDRVCFLTVSPAKGGACVDISAWLCVPPSFPRMAVDIDLARRHARSNEYVSPSRVFSHAGSYGCQGSLRLDIPHGFSLKMAASVNVIALYSASAGKIWILAVKLSSGESVSKNQNLRVCTVNDRADTLEFLKEGIAPMADVVHNKHVTAFEDSLLFIKCAMVDCNGPVYSLHLSFQHMLVGKQGGVRVWPLRPLIKPKKNKTDESSNRTVAGKRNPHLNGLMADADNASLGFEVQRSGEESNLDAAEEQMFLLRQERKKEFVAQDSLEIVSFDVVGLGLHDAVAQTVDNGGSVSADAKRFIQISGLEIHHRKNGMLYNPNAVWKRHSHIKPCVAASSKGSGDQKKHLMQNGQIRSLFVPFIGGKAEACFSKSSSQVAGIQQLSPRDFVVLDSAGQLHLLTLQKAMLYGKHLLGKSMNEDSKSSLLLMKPLKTLLPAMSFAILPPLLESGSAGPPPSSQRIWISDGAHSIHSMSFSDTATLNEGKAKSPSQDAGSLFLQALQVVFSGERVHSLVALSEDTILILTERSIATYVIPAV